MSKEGGEKNHWQKIKKELLGFSSSEGFPRGALFSNATAIPVPLPLDLALLFT
jgi:hypothetical protein